MDETQDAAPSSTEPVEPVVEFVAPAVEAGDAVQPPVDNDHVAPGCEPFREQPGNDSPTDADLLAQAEAARAEGYASDEEVAAILNDVNMTGEGHPAHALADQIGEHMAALDGSGDSLMARIAAEVKRLVGEIKEAL